MLTDDINQVLGQKARILSGMLPKYIPKLMQYNISLVAVNQLRDKIQIGKFPSPNEIITSVEDDSTILAFVIIPFKNILPCHYNTLVWNSNVMIDPDD